jgi:hypothetical protein
VEICRTLWKQQNTPTLQICFTDIRDCCVLVTINFIYYNSTYSISYQQLVREVLPKQQIISIPARYVWFLWTRKCEQGKVCIYYLVPLNTQTYADKLKYSFSNFIYQTFIHEVSQKQQSIFKLLYRNAYIAHRHAI